VDETVKTTYQLHNMVVNKPHLSKKVSNFWLYHCKF